MSAVYLCDPLMRALYRKPIFIVLPEKQRLCRAANDMLQLQIAGKGFLFSGIFFSSRCTQWSSKEACNKP